MFMNVPGTEGSEGLPPRTALSVLLVYMYRYNITGTTGTVLDLANTTVSAAAAACMYSTAVAVRLYGCTVDHVTGIQVADVAVLIMS